MNKRTNAKQAFTLIELLTVVAIIAILIGLLFPAINASIKKAEKAKVQATVTGLAVAFKGYYQEFGRWPVTTAGTCLMATNTFTNARNIVFYDFTDKDIVGGNFVDTWKKPYEFRIDDNYDNLVSPPTGPAVSGGVIVWSLGPDGAESTGDEIKSW